MLIDLKLLDEAEQSGKEKRVNMCKAIEEMRQSAREEGRAEIIHNMLKKSLSLEEIADLTGIPLEEVEKIAAN